MKTQNSCISSSHNLLTLSVKEVAQMLRPRPIEGHKGTFGHALLIAGSKGMAGAAILSCRACLHSGVGKLTIHTASANNVILQSSVPEAILSNDCNETVVTEPVSATPFQAIGIGPGLGTHHFTALALKSYLENCKCSLVLDADALNIIAQNKMGNLIPAGSIITPHVGEFERLAGPCNDQSERIEKALSFASAHEVYVALKGHPTLFITPQKEIFSCPYGNSGMATAGSGDVLTGLITGLLAQGYSSKEAAILGIWIHALSGDFAANELGEEYMLAGDIITHFVDAFKTLKKSNTNDIN